MPTSTRSPRPSPQLQLERLRRRLQSPRPDLPILRSTERRHHQPAPPSPATSSSHPNPTTPPQTSPATTPPTDPTPDWTRLLPLPSGLSAEFRRWLVRHIATHYNPSPHDSLQQLLAARIALALAHQHLAAAREPDQISPLWLRYEAMADRQYRAALRDWKAHLTSRPNPQPSPHSPPPTPKPPTPNTNPQHLTPPTNPNNPITPPNTPTPLNPHNPTFAHTNSPSSPLSAQPATPSTPISPPQTVSPPAPLADRPGHPLDP
ncbi:MAG: hypothetical protein KatS3mg108_0261 [Isosphaeraceae bacterium]|jgi:hypothetical protein|nr:MAG: hypothetical protein KatS3mg108_0261 [Isosphaeraceae bacterium]